MYLIVIYAEVSKDKMLDLAGGLLNPYLILFNFQFLHLNHLDLFLILAIFHHSNFVFLEQSFEYILQICLKMDIITGILNGLIQSNVILSIQSFLLFDPIDCYKIYFHHFSSNYNSHQINYSYNQVNL